MLTLPVTLEPKQTKKARTLRVIIDRDQLERLAAVLGLYRPEFLESLDRAEADVAAGRVTKLRSLADLRNA